MADQMETDEYRRIRVLWPDHLNLARGKYLPYRLADRGTRHCLSVFSLEYDRDMGPVPGTGSSRECRTWNAISTCRT